MTRIGDAIKLARCELGWKRERLAERSGYSRWCIKEIEIGRRFPKEATVVDIAMALEADIEHLACLWILDKLDRAREQIRTAGGWGEP